MTRVNEDGILTIATEPPGKCEDCGIIDETRPYGVSGKEVCFKCGKKNPKEMERQFQALMDGTHPYQPSN